MLFTNLSFEVQAGEVIWVKGPNGSGKSSLLRILAGLSQPKFGKVLSGLHPLRYFGHLPSVKGDLSPLENLLSASRLLGIPATIPDAMMALREIGLHPHASRMSRSLSQGQRHRLGLSRLLLDKGSVWLLDEPFNALDESARCWLSTLIQRHIAQGGAVILSSHLEIDLASTVQSSIIKLGIHTNLPS